MGPLMQAIGTRWAFRLYSGIALVTCLVYCTAERFMPPVKLEKHGEKSEKMLQEVAGNNNTEAER